MVELTCTNTDEAGRECARAVVPSSPVSMCQMHILLAAHFAMEMGGFGTGIVAAGGKKSGARLKYGRPSVVYYVQQDTRIKIGTTTDLPTRMQSIPHDALLAVEPGGNALERNRHREFAEFRVNGEWFEGSHRLLSHVSQTRRKYGEPMRAWEQVARHAAAKILDTGQIRIV